MGTRIWSNRDSEPTLYAVGTAETEASDLLGYKMSCTQRYAQLTVTLEVYSALIACGIEGDIPMGGKCGSEQWA